MIEADDFENDLFLAHGEGALLRGQLEQLAIIFLRGVVLGLDGPRQAKEQKIVERLCKALQPKDGPGQPKRPRFRGTNSEGFRQHLAANQNNREQGRGRKCNRSVAPNRDPKPHRDKRGISYGVAEHNRGEQFCRLEQ